MRSKKVTRYWCDFCNKAGLSAHAMRKHELHCTLNPDRKCRACDFLGGSHGVDLSELVAMLPDSSEYHNAHEIYGSDDNPHSRLTSAVNKAMPALREATQNCPACIMAALRQAKIPVPMVESFDFKAEMKSIFDDANEENRQIAGYY